MATRDQARLLACLFLQCHLQKALRIVELRGQQHVASDIEQVPHLVQHRLAAQEEVRHRQCLDSVIGYQSACPHTSGTGAHSLRQTHEVLGFRADFYQATTE